jgi:hypothetical protein
MLGEAASCQLLRVGGKDLIFVAHLMNGCLGTNAPVVAVEVKGLLQVGSAMVANPRAPKLTPHLVA